MNAEAATMDLAGVGLRAHGDTWQEMSAGTRFRTAARTITEADLVAFVNLAGLTEALFQDARHASELGFGGRLVPAMLTYSFAEGLVMQTNVLHRTAIAFLGMTLDARAPVYVGDTIEVVVEVTGSRRARSGDRGVVTARNIVLNQRGEVVLEYCPARMITGRRPDRGTGGPR